MASARRADVRRVDALVEADRCGERAARRAWPSRSSRSKGCSRQSNPNRSSSARWSPSDLGVGPVGVHLQPQPGDGSTTAATGSTSQPGPIFILTAGTPASTSAADLGHQRVDGGGLPDHRAELHRPSLDPEQVGQRAPIGPEVGVGNGHLQGGEGQRAPGADPLTASIPVGGGSRLPSARRLVEQGRDERTLEGGEGAFHVLVVIGGVTQGRALAPPLDGHAVLDGHQLHHDQGAAPMGPSGRLDRSEEGELDQPQLDGGDRRSGPEPSAPQASVALTSPVRSRIGAYGPRSEPSAGGFGASRCGDSSAAIRTLRRERRCPRRRAVLRHCHRLGGTTVSEPGRRYLCSPVGNSRAEIHMSDPQRSSERSPSVVRRGFLVAAAQKQSAIAVRADVKSRGGATER